MTIEQRLNHIAHGKTVLKARRNPKANIWEITYYNGTSYNTYSFDKFQNQEVCEDEIQRLQDAFPSRFVAELIDAK